mmetsp:Transcript_19679/g.29440  ORF Transcript_19679/g.29440 Transcript_19679/m.29440 type:complete len:492 (-) Transcript_19679:1269-2744(-)
MDFAKQLIKHKNVVTESGIQPLPLPTTNGDDGGNKMKNHVEKLLVQAANKAATDLFLSSGAKIYSTLNKNKEKPPTSTSQRSSSPPSEKPPDEKEGQSQSLVNCKLYPTQLLPPSSKILPSSLVVIFESFDSLDFVYAQPGEVFHNRNGQFHHDDFINKPYGCKIRSRDNKGVGFVYLLKPTPELWQRSLNHRTQIVHELDASLITFKLNLRPNMVVCESGTGSGALSHCIMRTIAPFGKLHTFEFNHARVKAAREEFKKNGVDHLVEVHWRDVCGKAKLFEGGKNDVQPSDGDEKESIGVGGFAIGAAKADAIFLDLPEPWLAIPHAAYTIKPYGNICSYSPCVEQSQHTIEEMKKYGFHSIQTIEVRLREHYVDEVEMSRVPTVKLPREPLIPYIPGAPPSENGKDLSDVNRPATDENGNQEKSEQHKTESNERPNGSNNPQDEVEGNPCKKRKLVCARPFGTIKGHTAFLTFAHAGNKSHPDPNEKSN